MRRREKRRSGNRAYQTKNDDGTHSVFVNDEPYDTPPLSGTQAVTFCARVLAGQAPEIALEKALEEE